jgi:hypothetical protein
MRSRTLPALCVSLLLLGLAGTIYKLHFPPGPIADEPAYVLMTQSLWHDHDLSYDRRDLERAYRIWDLGPNGLILATPDGGKTLRYGKPFIYPLAAVPFYAVFGVPGMVIFNMTLFLAMLWAAWWFWRGESGHVGLFLGGFFFASVAFSYVFWLQPEVFDMACAFFPLLIWQVVRRRAAWTWREPALLGVAGLMLAAGYISKEPLALMGAPIAIDLAWQRRFRGLLALAAPALLGVALLFAAQRHLTGGWSPYRGVQRRSFDSEYPFESQRDFWALYRGTSYGSWSALGVETSGRMLAYNAGYFVFGRHTGLLPYFPFALFTVGLYLAGPKNRSQHLLLLALLAYCAALLILRPNNFQGGMGFLGNRYFAGIYPALLFLPGRIAARRSLVLPFAAAGLWTASVVAVPLMQLAPQPGLQVHVRSAPFQALPLELTLLHKIPGYFFAPWPGGVWVVPKQNFYADEHHAHGVWVRGASRSEVDVVAPGPPADPLVLRFNVYSLSDANEVTFESSGERFSVRFDSEAKRQGAPVEIALHPVARNLGFFADAPQETFYRFVLTSTDGVVPAHRNAASQDLRNLGVFLGFEGPP